MDIPPPDPNGPWGITSRGRSLVLTDPQPEDVDLAEIGRALSNIGRFAGCTLSFYSVAEHCVHVGNALAAHTSEPAPAFSMLPEERRCLVLGGLLHDAAEAYLGDITWPVQQLLFDGPEGEGARERYKTAHRRLNAIIASKVGIDPEWLSHPYVREFDLAILHDERAVLHRPGDRLWDPRVESMKPLGVPIQGWMPPYAELNWISLVRYWASGASLPRPPVEGKMSPSESEPGRTESHPPVEFGRTIVPEER